MTIQSTARTTSFSNTRFAVTATAAFSIFLLLALLFRVKQGLDFTDEGFYLNWFSHKDEYDSAISLFGFFYSPIYKLFGERISAIRAFNLISLYLSGFIAIRTCLLVTYGKSQNQYNFAISPFLLSIGGASISLVSSGLLVTPSYNHLAIVGLQLVSSGLLYACLASPTNRYSARNLLYGILFSGGFALVCFAKSSTAVILTLLIVLLLTAGWKTGWSRMLLVYLFSAFIFTVFAFILFVGTPSDIIALLSNGKELTFLLDGGHKPIDLLKSSVKAILFWPPFPIFLALLALQYVAYNTYCSQIARKLSAGNILLILFFLAISTFLFFRPLDIPMYGYIVTRYGLLWFPALGVSALAAWVSLSKQLNLDLRRLTPHFCLAAVLLILPFCFAFGTNNNLWHQSLNAPIFFLMSAIVSAAALDFERHSLRWLSWLMKCFVVGLIPISLVVSASIQKPYRQPPLWKNSQSVCIRTCENKLLLSSDVASYIGDSRALALDKGFKIDTPILDLTGQSPGFVYAIGGRAIGSPWIIGNYRGSDAVAKRVIGRISGTLLKNAWILVEPGDHESAISSNVLEERGINLNDELRYEVVARIRVPVGVGGQARERIHVLYKPIF